MELMSSTESKLMWVAIVLSLVLVMALGTLAVLSVLGQDDGDDNDATAQTTSADTTGTDDDSTPADTSTNGGVDGPAAPGLSIGEIDPPVSVRCERAASADQGYAVVITNQGDTATDYVVSIELTVDGARPLVASTEIPALAAGERREVIVNAAGPGGRRIADCTIAAVQSDRRVLLANS